MKKKTTLYVILAHDDKDGTGTQQRCSALLRIFDNNIHLWETGAIGYFAGGRFRDHLAHQISLGYVIDGRRPRQTSTEDEVAAAIRFAIADKKDDFNKIIFVTGGRKPFFSHGLRVKVVLGRHQEKAKVHSIELQFMVLEQANWGPKDGLVEVALLPFEFVNKVGALKKFLGKA